MPDQQQTLPDKAWTLRACPKHRVAIKGERSCGCIVFMCGCVGTCDDYHHGDGVLLEADNG